MFTRIPICKSETNRVLETLYQGIGADWTAMNQSMKEAVYRARDIGCKLIEARRVSKNSSVFLMFKKMVAKDFGISERQTNIAFNIATYWHQIETSPEFAAKKTVETARKIAQIEYRKENPEDGRGRSKNKGKVINSNCPPHEPKQIDYTSSQPQTSIPAKKLGSPASTLQVVTNDETLAPEVILFEAQETFEEKNIESQTAGDQTKEEQKKAVSGRSPSSDFTISISITLAIKDKDLQELDLGVWQAETEDTLREQINDPFVIQRLCIDWNDDDPRGLEKYRPKTVENLQEELSALDEEKP